MGGSTLRWPADKEREEKEEVCSIGEEPHTENVDVCLPWHCSVTDDSNYLR